MSDTQVIVGIDVGTKTLGLALYTQAADLVTPLKTIRRTKWDADMAALRQIAKDYQARIAVVGYPMMPDGREGPRCQAVRAFIRMLEGEHIFEAIYRHDERYSSAEAEHMLLGIDASRETRRAVSDSVAAQVILQSFVDVQLYRS